MFAQRFFNLISRLIFSRWVRGYEEHHDPCEDACIARLGPLHLSVNHCFVMDHDDASIGLSIPTPLRGAQGWQWSKLHLGYTVCLGEDEIRPPGFYAYRLQPLRPSRPAPAPFEADEPFPF